MKKSLSKITSAAVMLCAGAYSFITKATGHDGFVKYRSFAQTDYWIRMDRELTVPETTSLLTTILTTIGKCMEYILIGLVLIIWLLSYLKIRKIEDKKLKAKKIKNTAIVIWIIVIITILIAVSKWMYRTGMLDKYIG